VNFDRVLDVNLRGTFMMMRAALPALLDSPTGGSIINFASTVLGEPRMVGYCASKAGVLELSRIAAMENATGGVRVNTICPEVHISVSDPVLRGPVLVRDQRTKDGTDVDGELGALAVYLASDESAHLTGAVLSLDDS
jgi:NAD(P)-dependent dehydrogenase (short-subunit alcohol dehydrogenase family)